jgi:hypothetical protein
MRVLIFLYLKLPVLLIVIYMQRYCRLQQSTMEDLTRMIEKMSLFLTAN